MLEQFALGLQSLRYTLRAIFDLRLWIPWTFLAAAEVLVVAALWNFAHPALSWLLAPMLTAVAGADALHYPRVFDLMPRLFDRADVVLGAVLGSVAIGAATPLFAAHFRGQTPQTGAALAMAARRAPALILVQLPFNLAVTLLGAAVEAWLARRGGGGLVGRAAGGMVAGASLVAQALFFFAAARVVLARRSAWGAWQDLPSTWPRALWSALFVGAVMLLLLVPIQWIAGQQNLVIERGRPELIGWITLVRVGAGLFNWFVLTGCATLIYLSAVQPEEEAR